MMISRGARTLRLRAFEFKPGRPTNERGLWEVGAWRTENNNKRHAKSNFDVPNSDFEPVFRT